MARRSAGLVATAMLFAAMAAASGVHADMDDPPPAGSATRGDSYYYYCLSRQAMHRHEFVEAIDYMNRAVEADPGSLELLLDLARLHLDLEQPEPAAAAARKAVSKHPDSAAAHAVLAAAVFAITQSGDAGEAEYLQAIDAYQDLLELDPENAPAWLSVAKLFVARGSLLQALEALRRHMDLDPSSEEGVFLGSQVLMRLDRLDEAQRLLESATRQVPGNAQFALALSEVYERRGDFEGAIRIVQGLAGQRIDPIRVHFILARLYQRMGKHSDAYGHLSRMAAIMDERPRDYGEEDRAEIRLRMIRALIQADRTAEAIAQAEQGSERFPSEVRFVLRKGEALLMAGRTKQAEEVFREEIARREGDVTLLGMIADAYLSAGASREQAGDLEAAEAHLRKSIDLDPLNDSALNYLGYMLAEQGRLLDEAVVLIQRALERDPGNGAYLDSLGWAYFKKGDYPRSEAALASALEAMRDEPAIHAHLGDLYYATGRMEEAVRAWQEAIERGAENADDLRARLTAARAAGAAP